MLTEKLTANVSLELEKSNVALNRWIERKSDWLDSSDLNYKQQAEECIFTISALKENGLQIENAREKQSYIKLQQQREITDCNNFVNQLLNEKQELLQKLSQSEIEGEREKQRLLNAQNELNSIHQKIQYSINSLSEGMSKYAAFGLEFQRSEGESMKFIFTQIDQKEPQKPFSFTMYVDSSDIYNLVETRPVLEVGFCDKLMETLNKDNDIRKFVIQMRKAFIKKVHIR
jgi:hypothetical protein